jgi:hypothetical protein
MICPKHIFERGGSGGWKSGAGMLCLILALAAGGGCGKPKNATTAVPPPPASDSAAAPEANSVPANRMQPTPPPVSFDSSPNGPTQVQSLNRALLGWKMKNHRRPQNFEEFASTAGFQIPAPPAGKKYALDSKGFIVLVNSN